MTGDLFLEIFLICFEAKNIIMVNWEAVSQHVQEHSEIHIAGHSECKWANRYGRRLERISDAFYYSSPHYCAFSGAAWKYSLEIVIIAFVLKKIMKAAHIVLGWSNVRNFEKTVCFLFYISKLMCSL